ncbi:MAG: hypothetical protein ACW987_18695 [Candidatus Thorarchaeota archaeon]|jgi:hypothetical protein
MSKPDYPMTRCEGCKGLLIASIQVCVCCDDRYVAQICHECERGWGWDYRARQWVELEEVTEND